MLASFFRELEKLEIEVFLGVELEFYSHLSKEYFAFKNVELKDEIGKGQIEAIFPYKNNFFEVLRDVIKFRNSFRSLANFNAFIDLKTPPSALQFNVSIFKNGKNILSNAILQSVLQNTKNNLEVFAPTQNCKQRLKEIALIREFRNSPYTFCIGGKNNRTSAIRVKDDYFEHRIPSPNCKIIKSFSVILEAIIEGINKEDVIDLPILHSNAFEDEVIMSFGLIKICDAFENI